MLCTGAKQCYFMAYLWHRNKEYHFTRIVPRDEAKIALILDRCQKVIELKLQYIEKLNMSQNDIILTIHDPQLHNTLIYHSPQ